VVGTIHYVAPEQIEGTRVSARTDVYSLGCLLFHCLTGQVPFGRDTDVAVIYAHLSEEPPRLSSVRPELSGGLDAVLAKALDKSPDRRFPTCGDLVNAARAVIDAAGPLADTAPPRSARGGGSESALGLGMSDRDAVGAAIDGMRGEAAVARRPLVILDHDGMGEPAGRLVDSLRDDALTSDTKVLLLVDVARADDREVTASGADERLAMPFSPLQLQVKLRKLLGPEAVRG
jgi:serine/threonine-protein kinase